jgi:prepilin peptidase CpaA
VPTLKALLFGVLALSLVIALATDLKSRRIPDLLTFPAMAIALGLRAWFEGLGDANTGLVAGLLGLVGAAGWFGAFALRKKGLGWGDVKLAGVVGATLGGPLSLAAVLFISLAGAFQAVVSLIWQGDLSDTVRGVLGAEGSTNTPKRQIPYGVAIAIGSLGAMWWDGNAF